MVDCDTAAQRETGTRLRKKKEKKKQEKKTRARNKLNTGNDAIKVWTVKDEGSGQPDCKQKDKPDNEEEEAG